MIQHDGAGNRCIQQRGKQASGTNRTRQQIPPMASAPGSLWRDPADGREMVYVPPGRFVFGAPPSVGRASWAAPLIAEQRVHLDGYWIDRAAVSNNAYRRFVEQTGYPEPRSWHEGLRGGDVMVSRELPWREMGDLPVVVTWDEAMAYCRWALKTLPSEEEWEKAARGTDGRRYPWGPQWPKELGTGWSKPQIDLASLDVSPLGCLGMFHSQEWTRSRGADGSVVLKGYPVSPGPTWGAPFEPFVAALWFRDLGDTGTCAAFRCVLGPRPETRSRTGTPRTRATSSGQDGKSL